MLDTLERRILDAARVSIAVISVEETRRTAQGERETGDHKLENRGPTGGRKMKRNARGKEELRMHTRAGKRPRGLRWSKWRAKSICKTSLFTL